MKESKTTVDEYITCQSVEDRESLEDLRSIIKSEVPEAEELISYQIPSFRLHYMLVAIGVKKGAVCLYTMNPNLVSSLQAELKGLGIKYAGSTLYFLPGKPLPKEMIKKLVRMRADENKTKFNASK